MKWSQIQAVVLAGLSLAWRPHAAVEEPARNHWSFQPVREPAAPQVRDAGWCRNSLDRFLMAGWERSGIRPAPEADRRTLLRRLSYDLTGLPPSAGELDAFEADPAPDAFERKLDELLASPRYGEHWGRHWLDVVRYADTAGETADYPVPVAWRYRNYVIDAFNADKPYSEFLREQIAGDILARRGPRDRYAERVTATGFLAVSRRFGFDSENYHHLTIQDTIDTLGQVVMGLTLGCARCHAHKYDPVSMPDYYALYGIFESTRYAFPGSEQKQKHRSMVPLLPPEEALPQWRDYEARVASLARKVEAGKLPVPAAMLHSLDDMDGGFEMQAPAAGGSKGVLVPPWVYEGLISVTTEAQSPFKNLHPRGRVGAAIASGDRPYRMEQALHPQRNRGDSGLVHVNLDFRLSTNATPAPSGHRFWIGASATDPAVEVLLSDSTLRVRTDGDWEPIGGSRSNLWCNLRLSLDLRTERVVVSLGDAGGVADLPARALSRRWSGKLGRVGIQSFGDRGAYPGIAIDNLGVQGLAIPAVTAGEVAMTPVTGPGAGGGADAGRGGTEAEAARRELERMVAEGPFELAYAVSEGTPGNARIQLRGEPDQLGEPVERGFPVAFQGRRLPPSATGSGRLELAEWLVDAANPLTARVMVNRIWQYHFGLGLVPTPNDFGTRGQPPSHPALLDYLAARFVREGWSVKAMHRLILASATYRQASSRAGDPGSGHPDSSVAECPVDAATGVTRRRPAEAVTAPAANAFTPFPRRRLSAEELRDAGLLVSNGLEGAMGRGHPFPTPTGWGYTQHGPFSAVYDHHLRSVYLMTQRLKRHPFLALFDGPDPNASTAMRRTTTVPTQALYFLNDPVVHAMASGLASGILEAGSTQAQRIVEAYRRALGRSPTAVEAAEAAGFLAAYEGELEATGMGSGPGREPWVALARVLLGSNEFLTVD